MKSGPRIQRIKNPVWKEVTDGFGRTKWKCYDDDKLIKLIGEVSYNPENISRPWKAFTPGPNVWETFFFNTEKEAKDFVIERVSLKRISPFKGQKKLFTGMPRPIYNDFEEEELE